jgi:hypothetical protein
VTVYVHIGLHKTGTSSIQAFLRKNKPALLERGWLYPRTGWTAGGHHNLAYELLGRKRFSEAAGRLSELEAEIAQAPNAIVSSEELEFLELAEVRRLKAAIGERETRILVYLRRQDALIGSTYAQQVKMGARMKPFDDYALASLYNPRFDFAQLLSRWGGVFGREALEVAVVSDETAGPRLYDDFLARVGLGEAADLPRPGKRMNESPTAAEIEILRRAADKARRPGRPPRPQDMLQLQEIAAALVEETPALQGAGRLALSPQMYARVAARFGPGNARAAAMVSGKPMRRALAFDAYSPPEAAEVAPAAAARAIGKALKRWDFAAQAEG